MFYIITKTALKTVFEIQLFSIHSIIVKIMLRNAFEIQVFSIHSFM